jgi:hypothetical protein
MAGFGTVLLARSSALQVVTPAKVNIKITADNREKKLDITNSLAIQAIPGASMVRVRRRAKVTDFRPNYLTGPPAM